MGFLSFSNAAAFGHSFPAALCGAVTATSCCVFDDPSKQIPYHVALLVLASPALARRGASINVSWLWRSRSIFCPGLSRRRSSVLIHYVQNSLPFVESNTFSYADVRSKTCYPVIILVTQSHLIGHKVQFCLGWPLSWRFGAMFLWTAVLVDFSSLLFTAWGVHKLVNVFLF